VAALSEEDAGALLDLKLQSLAKKGLL
jgi:hypothetical protein